LESRSRMAGARVIYRSHEKRALPPHRHPTSHFRRRVGSPLRRRRLRSRTAYARRKPEASRSRYLQRRPRRSEGTILESSTQARRRGGSMASRRWDPARRSALEKLPKERSLALPGATHSRRSVIAAYPGPLLGAVSRQLLLARIAQSYPGQTRPSHCFTQRREQHHDRPRILE
jgi:hypothetical protein